MTEADAVGGNQQQKQANTDTGSVGRPQWQVTQNQLHGTVAEITVNSTPIRIRRQARPGR